jgi:uncharacterized protein YndB with AHSA1/START domain
MPSPSHALTVTYTIHASAQEVFKAWITPQLLQRWGPERATVDAKVGGRFRFETAAEENSKLQHVVTGEYKQLVPAHLLVQSWIYEGPMSPGNKVETLVTVNFNELEPKVVEVIVTEEGPSLADEETRESGEQAWKEALKMLEILCSSR